MTFEFAENIQRGIIYLSKYNREFYLQIKPLVKTDYFEYPTHSGIFEVIGSYYDKYKKLPTDEFLLEYCKDFKKKGTPLSEYEDEIHLVNSMDPKVLQHQNFILDKIEEFARTEAMKDAIQEGISLLREGRLGEIEAGIRKALNVSREVELGQSYFRDYEARLKRNEDIKGFNSFKTIFPTMNRVMGGGLARGEIAMVVAPPGVGKSLYLVNQGIISLTENKKVLYISLEMSEDKISKRFDSIITQIQQDALSHKKDIFTDRLKIFSNKFPNGNLIIKQFPSLSISMNNIRAYLCQLETYEDFKPDVIILDYLELLNATREGMKEYESQERIANEFAGLAQETKCLGWTATQTNREGKKVNIITDTELAAAYGKIRPFDFSISLNQTEEEYDNGRMRAYIMKARDARAKFIIPMEIDYNTLTMSELTETSNGNTETNQP